ncbi:MAG TPA: hypothetical protein VFH97_06775 [Gemmatimonadales bacterium]|nr:hypothetical protein [Gemmatimonadales bacterium]
MRAIGRAVRTAGSAVATALVLLAVAAGPALACPSCKVALGTSDRWQTAFNASVLFMMSMPFAVVAVVGGAVYRSHRRRRAAPHPPDTPPAA